MCCPIQLDSSHPSQPFDQLPVIWLASCHLASSHPFVFFSWHPAIELACSYLIAIWLLSCQLAVLQSLVYFTVIWLCHSRLAVPKPDMFAYWQSHLVSEMQQKKENMFPVTFQLLLLQFDLTIGHLFYQARAERGIFPN